MLTRKPRIGETIINVISGESIGIVKGFSDTHAFYNVTDEAKGSLCWVDNGKDTLPFIWQFNENSKGFFTLNNQHSIKGE